MTFTLELQKFAAKTGAKMDELVEDVVGYTITQIDKRSPVGNPALWKSPPPAGYVGGRFRGNWQLGVGTVPAGVVARVDPGGLATVTAAIGEIPTDAAGRVYFYVNNLPYAQRLEHGYSTQAPAGIVGLTLIDAGARAESTARELNAK